VGVPNRVGKIEPNDWRRQHFLDWLCCIAEDRDPPTMKALAEKLALSYETLNRWKKDADFLTDWESQYRQTVGSPEKAQRVVEKLYETAEDRTDPRQVSAAKAYLEAIDAIKPKRVEVTVNKAAKDLSDDDLYRILAERAEQELKQRSDA
jgi:hypothetical protein